MDIQKTVKAYLNIRNHRSDIKKAFTDADNALKESQALLEAAMLGFFQENKMDSVRTDAGTFYRQEDIKPVGSDWSVFYKWMTENDAFEFLQKRLSKGPVVAHMDDNDGDPPPGVSVYREYVIRVRQPK